MFTDVPNRDQTIMNNYSISIGSDSLYVIELLDGSFHAIDEKSQRAYQTHEISSAWKGSSPGTAGIIASASYTDFEIRRLNLSYSLTTISSKVSS